MSIEILINDLGRLSRNKPSMFEVSVNKTKDKIYLNFSDLSLLTNKNNEVGCNMLHITVDYYDLSYTVILFSNGEGLSNLEDFISEISSELKRVIIFHLDVFQERILTTSRVGPTNKKNHIYKGSV